MHRISLLLLLILLPIKAAAQPSDESCGPAPAYEALMERAIELLGIDSTRILHFGAGEYVVQAFQSERTYPPFFSLVRQSEIWYDPATRVQRTQSEFVYPGFGPNKMPAMLSDDRSAFVDRNGTLIPAPGGMGGQSLYALNPWAAVPTFRAAELTEECVYRDYPRAVFTRADGVRLYVDPETAYPVKLDLVEPHYLWGQVHVEYRYGLWDTVEGSAYPRAAYRIVDGSVEISQTIGAVDFLAPADAPLMALPDDQAPAAASSTPMFLQPLPPDTMRVADDIYLLKNPGYTEAVALVGDTVFVFDATQAAERARQDHEWVKKLFPGDHPVIVVVTDLAWPHIAGVRYWVAQGATILSHPMSEDFLRRVVDREWTLEPDPLEKRRRSMIFQGVDEITTVAGVRIIPIDGIGSEGALIAFIPANGFLWASDYIQTLDRPTGYTNEVRAAVRRAGIQPKQVAAQHLPLTSWSDVEALEW